jgi:3-oxoacyl-[acyl-carrier protein] reductase
MKKLSHKTALITGAGRGIGRATALTFADEGADLILIARTQSQLNETASLCKKAGAKVITKTVDLADLSQIDGFFESIKDDVNKIDILVNNAGMFDGGPINKYPPKNLRKMLEVNLISVMYLSQKVIGLMDSRKGGTIVNVSSLSGCFGMEKFPGFGAYNISKYALWGLTEIMALENKDRIIRVNQVSPGGVDTAMFRQAVPPGVEPGLKPDEVAAKILYLASDDSAPKTGENLIMANK